MSIPPAAHLSVTSLGRLRNVLMGSTVVLSLVSNCADDFSEWATYWSDMLTDLNQAWLLDNIEYGKGLKCESEGLVLECLKVALLGLEGIFSRERHERLTSAQDAAL